MIGEAPPVFRRKSRDSGISCTRLDSVRTVLKFNIGFIFNCSIFFFFLNVVLEIEHRALCILDKHSTNRAKTPVLTFLYSESASMIMHLIEEKDLNKAYNSSHPFRSWQFLGVLLIIKKKEHGTWEV